MQLWSALPCLIYIYFLIYVFKVCHDVVTEAYSDRHKPNLAL